MKGCHLRVLIAHKVIIKKEVIFIEDKKKLVDNNTINESSMTTIVHVEKEYIEDSYKVYQMHKIQERVEANSFIQSDNKTLKLAM